MLEKGLKLVFPVIIGLMALAISYVFIVEANHLNAIFGIAIALVIAIIASGIYLFSISILPTFLFIMGKNAKRLLCRTTSQRKKLQVKEDHLGKEANPDTDDSQTKVEAINKWEKAKDELMSYAEQEIFDFFPNLHHSSLLQIIEDFASNNIACSSPIRCTLKETDGLSAGDICHFIGNLVLKFKQADKNKVMNRHSACNFAKNAFPNILTQDVSYIYSHLVQHNDYSKIRNFKKKEL